MIHQRYFKYANPAKLSLHIIGQPFTLDKARIVKRLLLILIIKVQFCNLRDLNKHIYILHIYTHHLLFNFTYFIQAVLNFYLLLIKCKDAFLFPSFNLLKNPKNLFHRFLKQVVNLSCYHLNTELVCQSDPHCIYQVLSASGTWKCI